LTQLDKFRKSSTPSDGLNNFLNKLSSEGGLHSQGQFTISMEKALEKLKKFQLTDPNLFILNLVSAAMLLSSSYFRVVTSEAQVRIDFDGKMLTKEQLQSLFISEEPALKELAVALTALKSLEPANLVFRSQGGLFWNGATPRFSDDGESVNVLEFEQSRADKPPWLELLKTFTAFCPMPIYLGQNPIPRGALSVHAPAFQIFSRYYPLPKLSKVGRDALQISTHGSSTQFSALVGTPVNDWANQWHLVYRGITFTRTTEEISFGGLGGVIISNNFQKNLSHSDLVENEYTTNILKSLEKSILEYIQDDLCTTKLYGREAKSWTQAAFWAAEKLLKGSSHAKATRIEAWAHSHRNGINNGADPVFPRPERYDDPTSFLIHYFHWSGSTNVKEALSVLRESRPPTLKSEEFLQPWLKGSLAKARLTLFRFLVTVFPEHLSWDVVRPLVDDLLKTLPAQDAVPNVIKPLLAQVNADHTDLRREAQLCLCEAASFLDAGEAFDFMQWLTQKLDSNQINLSNTLRSWLLKSPYGELTKAVFNARRDDKKKESLTRVSKHYLRTLQFKPEDVAGIRKHLENALQHCHDEKECWELRTLARTFGETSFVEPPPESMKGAWEVHRYALLLALNLAFGEATKLHLLAHSRLEGHWFSYLLLADNALQLNQGREAHRYYVESLKRHPGSACAEEGVAESSPYDQRLAAWLRIAQAASHDKLQSNFAYREALELNRGMHLPIQQSGLGSWAKLQIAANFAEHLADDPITSRRMSWFEVTSNFIVTSLLRPSAARAFVRRLRRRKKNDEAGRELARHRLLQQLSQPVSGELRWKKTFTDSPATELRVLRP
jgi:hypothetical protein